MIGFELILLIGFIIGLYAGKRRANGKSWCEIFREMFLGIWSIITSAWRKVCELFVKDDPTTPR